MLILENAQKTQRFQNEKTNCDIKMMHNSFLTILEIKELLLLYHDKDDLLHIEKPLH